MILNWTYTIAAVLTFGWVAATFPGCAWESKTPRVCRVTTASLGAVAWPAYWSWALIEAVRGRG
jgi:hypothetical protein